MNSAPRGKIRRPPSRRSLLPSVTARKTVSKPDQGDQRLRGGIRRQNRPLPKDELTAAGIETIDQYAFEFIEQSAIATSRTISIA